MSGIVQEAVDFAEAQLLPLAAEGGHATFMGVPVDQLSREALLGLVGHLGREQIRRDESIMRERSLRLEIARARRRG